MSVHQTATDALSGDATTWKVAVVPSSSSKSRASDQDVEARSVRMSPSHARCSETLPTWIARRAEPRLVRRCVPRLRPHGNRIRWAVPQLGCARIRASVRAAARCRRKCAATSRRSLNGTEAARHLHACGLTAPLIAGIACTSISAAKTWLVGTAAAPEGAASLRLQVAARVLDALAPPRRVSTLTFADLAARHCR